MDKNEKLFNALQAQTANPETNIKVFKNFVDTFRNLGAKKNEATKTAAFIFYTILEKHSLRECEKEILYFFQNQKFGYLNILDKIEKGLKLRTETIYSQIKKHLDGLEKIIDYGCGSGLLAQKIKDNKNILIDAFDVRDFRSPEIKIPIKTFNGYDIPVKEKSYQGAIAIHVLHHEKDNENIIKELNRIVSKRLIIIETVPEGKTKEEAKKDWGRLFLNDVLWNRFFNYANIPVPGTYQMAPEWIERFEKYFWKCTDSVDLGFDQPTIQDRHWLLVFEK